MYILFHRLIPIEELSVGQMSILRKLSLIRLTALLDLYKAKINVYVHAWVGINCMSYNICTITGQEF